MNLLELATEIIPLLHGTPTNEKRHSKIPFQTVSIAVQEHIKVLLTNDALLADVARRSHHHTNGFEKIVLFDNPETGFKIRLHAWWPNSLSTTLGEHIHDHPWHFWSAVLNGELTTDVFTISAIGKQYFQYSVESLAEGEGYRREQIGTESLRCDLSTEMPEGAMYFMTHDCLHRARSAGLTPAVTLMIHGRFLRRISRVFTEQPISDIAYNPFAPYTSTELKALLNKIESLL